MPKVTIPKVTIPKLNLAERAASVQKSKGYALARTLGRRNAEMIRKYGARAGVAARQATVRTAQRVKAARMDSKPFSQIVQQTRSAVQQPGPWFDNAVTRLQTRLEKSDAAVLIFTVGVIVACIALTWLAVYLWNRF
jgi:hypothetical protein